MLTNLRLAVRTLGQTPVVTAVAVVSLALGIGANAAMFSLVDELLLRPLPVQEPGRLVNLAAPGPRSGSDSCTQAGRCEVVFSYPMYQDLARAPQTRTVLTGLAAHRLFPATLAFRGRDTRPVVGEGVLVSGTYFPVLGLRPALGRLLTPADDLVISGGAVAVLSHRYWRTELGADPGVLGRAVDVNGQSLRVVGVAPEGFEGTTLGVRPRVFVPLTMAMTVSPFAVPPSSFTDRRWYWVYLFGRLRPGASVAQARAALNAVYRPVLVGVDAPLQEGLSAQAMTRFRARTLTVEGGARGQSVLQGATRTPLAFLFAITGLVVLIACANIANLLLARAAARTGEMALRLSLGAGRRRLIGQLLTESCVLAVAGGAAGLVVAHGVLGLVASLVPPAELGTGAALALTLRPSVLGFAAAISLGTGLLFGVVPALQSTHPDLVTAIRASSGQPSGARAAARTRTALVTAQMGLATALLIAAGLFVQSLRNVSRVELGVATDHVVTFALAPVLNGYPPARERAVFAQVEAALAATRGVTGVAAGTVPLFTGGTTGGDVRVEGFAAGPDVDVDARRNRVSSGYFRTLGISLLAGREFTDADRLGAGRVAVVNEAFAKKFGLGRGAVGRRMAVGKGPDATALDITIVGLARDAKYSDVKGEVPPLFFTPYRQDSTVGGLVFYARTALAPERLLAAVPGILGRVDPLLPPVGLKTLPAQVRENVYLDRMIGGLSAGFAGLATLLAAVGLYGVLAYTVAQRTREMGLRIALGASPGRVRALVLGQVGRMVLVGAAAGVAAALGLGRAAQALLFGVGGHDPAVVAAAVGVLAVVALGAAYLPARRASRVEPMRALRYE